MDILRRKAAFDDDPDGFGEEWRKSQEELAEKIGQARKRLPSIPLDDNVLERIVAVTAALRLDGHRADIVIMKAARALAAFRELTAIGAAEIRDAALLALLHRQKRLPFEEMGSEQGRLRAALEENLPCA